MPGPSSVSGGASGIRTPDQLIETLLTEQVIAGRWATHRREMYGSVHFIKNSGRFRLFAPGNLGKGDFNVFRMFIETALDHTRPGGWAGQVTPEGLYNGANSMAIREMLFDHFSLAVLLGFENSREIWFKGVDSRTKFCIYAASKGGRTDAFRAMFNIRTLPQLAEATDGAALEIPIRLVREFSPDALALMEFSDQREIDIAEKLYSRWPKLGETPSDPLYRLYMREIDMGNDRELFDDDASGVPVYEGRMVWHFDHRAKAYRSGRGRSADWLDYAFGDRSKEITPQWFISRANVPVKVRERMQRYRVGFCDVGSPTNERTLVAALIPPNTVCGHSLPTITFVDGYEWGYLTWLAVANSFAMDYLVRKKVSLHMAYTVMDSLPFPRLEVGDSRLNRIAPLVLRLSCTGAEMIPFWNAMVKFGWVEPVTLAGQPPGLEDEMERLNARAELDAVVARDLFGLTPDEMSYILEAFPTARKYEMAKYGSFRSRDLILERMLKTAVAANRDAVA